jgi:hypothetical protein
MKADDLQKLYDIQFSINLSLNRGEAEILLDSLEEYGLQAHNDTAYTGVDDGVADIVDNIVSMITLFMTEQESALEKELGIK